MSKLLTVFAALIALTAFAAPASAEIEYPWCAYYGRTGSSGTNCGFTSLPQCRATVSGIGGYCARNPRYHGRRRN